MIKVNDTLVCLNCGQEGALEEFLPQELMKDYIEWHCPCSAQHVFRFIETGEIEMMLIRLKVEFIHFI
jgi:hypothetical protein